MALRRLLPFLLCAFLLAGVGTAARAEPPLWRVSSPYARIYMLGTIHQLPKNFAWDSKRVEDIMGKTREFYLEISDEALFRDMGQAYRDLGFDANAHLKTKLSPREYQQLSGLPVVQKIKMDGDPVDQMRPWFATMVYGCRPVENGPYAAGVDFWILKKAITSSTPVYGLESPARALSVFSKMPDEKALATLHDALAGKHADPKLLNALFPVWAAGDLPAIERIVEQMHGDDGDLYQALLPDRNKYWVDGTLAPRMGVGGTVFMAVGLAHLIGPDSVLALMKAKGFKVERVDVGK